MAFVVVIGYTGIMDLTKVLQQLSASSDLQVINTKVESRLELAAICRREFNKPDGGRALLFKQVDDSDFAVAANLFGNECRTSQFLACDSFAQFSSKLQQYLTTKTGTAAERFISENTNDNDVLTAKTNLLHSPYTTLTDLPAIQSWPQEKGGYINLAVTITEHPQTGSRNLGLYRAQVVDSKRLAISFSPNSGAAEHLRAAAVEKKQLPISLVVGGDPALLWAAAAPLPKNCNEIAVIQSLFNRAITFTAGLSQPLAVPASAEIIIEGLITPGEVITEGPFGNHTGQYVSRLDCPVMQVTAIRHKPAAILPTTVVGPPPSENINLGRLNEILIRQMLQIDYPEIIDIEMPLDTIFHGATLLSIKPQSSNQNRDLIADLWKNSALRSSGLIVLVDEDINLKSSAKCWWRTVNMLNTQKLYQQDGRIAIDATGVNPANLVVEDIETQALLQRRKEEYNI